MDIMPPTLVAFPSLRHPATVRLVMMEDWTGAWNGDQTSKPRGFDHKVPRVLHNLVLWEETSRLLRYAVFNATL